MKTILVMGLLTLSSTAFSSVVKSYDSEKSCTLYRVIGENSKVKQNNETVIYAKTAFGLVLEDLEINFDNREARTQVVISVVLGLNRSITNEKSIIEENNSQFKMLINQVNRKVLSLEKVCISRDNKIIYGKIVE